MKRFEELERENVKLLHVISVNDNQDETIKAKKQFHKNKLEMLELIHASEKINCKSARNLFKEVANKPKVPRYAVGIAPIDAKLNGGIEIGTLLILAGESFTGKTTLMLEILANVSEGSEVVLFNFEMGETRISHKLQQSLKTEKQLDNFLIDSSTRNLSDLIMEIELHSHNGVKFFGIDSKMKIEVSGNMDEHLKISSITRELSKICQRLDIIIILINQLSESDIKNGRLSFKGSGDQQYDSDISWFYTKDAKTMKRKLICNKNRQDDYEYIIHLDYAYGKTIQGFIPNESESKGSNFRVTTRVPNQPIETSYEIPDEDMF